MHSILDSLLGRQELRDQILNLRSEKEELESRLEAENKRRSEAVTEKQEAQRRINKLESKIDELEGRIARKEDRKRDRGFRFTKKTGLAETRLFLDYLGSMKSSDERQTSLYIPPGEGIPSDLDIPRKYLVEDIDSATGKAVFTDDYDLVRVTATPPIEITDINLAQSDSFNIEHSYFEPQGTHLVVIIRSDSYAAAIYQGDEAQSQRHHSTDVMGKHSKGGFSQSRFERKREEQIDKHLEEAMIYTKELTQDTEVDYAVYAGDKDIAKKLQKRLDPSYPVTTKAIDSRGDKQDLLEAGAREIWSTRLYFF